MKKISMVFLAFSMVFTVLVGCGPTKQELAKRHRLEEERKALIVERQMKLKDQVSRRIAAGEAQPNKPNDPGYEIVNLIRPKLSDDAITIRGLPGVDGLLPSNVICGNTKGGREILEWRRWYCKDQPEDCIYSVWKDGQPTFEVTIQKTTTLKLSDGTFIFKPGNTLSPK